MIDVKKLISGFLILAIAAVFSGLILMYAETASTGAPSVATGPTITGIGGNATGTVPVFGNNAFVDTGSLQGNAAEVLSEMNVPSATIAAASDPTNLTNTFAESFINGFTAANPQGAITDSNGGTIFNSPDTQAIAESLAADPVFQNFQAPDWDAQVAQVKIITTSDTPANINNYESSFNAIYQKYIANSSIGGVLGQEDPNSAAAVQAQIQEMLQTAAAIPTPASLMNAQESLIKLLVYEKNLVALLGGAQSDPLKASIIFQNEQSKYDLAVSNFESEWSKMTAKYPFQMSLLPVPAHDHGVFAFINNFMGIPVAHAQFAVVDAVVEFNSTAQLGKTIEKYVEDIALQILINVLTNLIQQKVLTAIQGAGAPQFITDFGSEMVNSFTSAAVTEIGSYMKCVPSYQAPFVQALLSTPSVANADICQSEFNGQLGNGLQNFYNNFDNFNNYLSLFQPGGNVWALAIQTRDAALIAGGNSQQAKTTQNTSTGWKGVATCSDHSNPYGVGYTCPDGGTLDTSTNPPTCNMGPGMIPEQAIANPNLGKCADGSNPQIKSPSDVTKESFTSVLKGGLDNITSAKNITGILEALLSSILNTLATNAINLSTQELTNITNGNNSTVPSGAYGLTGISSSSLSLSQPTSSTAIQCVPAQQSTIFNPATSQAGASFSAAGGAINTTCSANNSCPSGRNSDGTPTYTWSAPGSMQAASGTTAVGDSYFATYTATGTYYVTVTASTDQTTATCQVDVQ